MPQVPDVSAIVEHVKARIKHIEGELARQERLSDELERLRDALGRLEGAARSRVTIAAAGRRSDPPHALGRPALLGARARPPAHRAGRTRPRCSRRSRADR
jgi:hypothetical protein